MLSSCGSTSPGRPFGGGQILCRRPKAVAQCRPRARQTIDIAGKSGLDRVLVLSHLSQALFPNKDLTARSRAVPRSCCTSPVFGALPKTRTPMSTARAGVRPPHRALRLG